MLTVETKRHIDTARQILVGKVPDPKQQIDQITNALIYKFMDDMDVKSIDAGGKPSFFKGDLEQYAWRKLMDPRKGAQERLNLYTEALEKFSTAAQLPQLFRDIFRQAFLPYRDPETLNLFLKEIEYFDYNHSEELGNAFEYLLSIMGSQGDAGQFRTPRHIIEFIVDIVDPDINDTILDPACGTAGFLISAYKHIVEKYDGVDSLTGKPNKETKLTHNQHQNLLDNLEGYDISSDMVKLARVNMYLHGNRQPRIHEYDTLTSEERWGDSFDVIMANPPFMSPKGGIRPHNKFGVESSRAEVLFVDYIMSHLKQNGRAGIIVPEGIIFQSGKSYKQLRKNLVEDGLLAVISLPAGVFNPYSGVKTSILIFDNAAAKRTKYVLFLKIDNDGLDLGTQRRPILGSELQMAVECLTEYRKSVMDREIDELGWPSPPKAEVDTCPIVGGLISKSELSKSGDYNLSATRYLVAEANQNQKWPLVKLEDIFIEIKNGKNVKQTDEPVGYKVSRIQTIAKGVVDLDAIKWTNDVVKEIDFLQEGDILFSHINSIDHLAKTAIFESNEKVIHGANLLRLRADKSKVLSKYALYIFKSKIFLDDAKRFAQKAVNQASINSTAIKNLQMPLPPMEVQKEIVAELDGYQKIIHGARQVVENYKPTIKIDPEWPIVKVGEIAELVSGGTPSRSKSTYWGGDIKWISSRYFTDDHKLSGYESITKEGLKNSSSSIAPKGSTILITRVSVGKYAYADQEYALNQDLTALVAKDAKVIDPEYLYRISYILAEKIKQGAMGVGVTGVTKKFVADLQIPLPDPTTQLNIVADMKVETDIIDANKKLIKIYEQKIKDKIAEVWGE